MRHIGLAVLVGFALANPAGAADAALGELLDRLEQTSRQQPPLAHIDTLLSTAELLPPDRFGERRRLLLDSAVSLLSAVPEGESRYFYLQGAARLLAVQDRMEAEQVCRRIPVRQSASWRTDYRGQCWQGLGQDRETVLNGLRNGAFHMPAVLDLIAAHPPHGGEILQEMMRAFPGRRAGFEDHALLDKAARLVAPFNLALAQEAARLLRNNPPAERPAASEDVDDEVSPDERAEAAMRAADDLSLPPGERSGRMARVLDLSVRVKNLTQRLRFQGYLAAWFTAEGSTGLATKASEALNTTLNTMCTDVTCLESVDDFVEYLAKQRIDPENLRVRHPSLGARLLLYELRMQVGR